MNLVNGRSIVKSCSVIVFLITLTILLSARTLLAQTSSFELSPTADATLQDNGNGFDEIIENEVLTAQNFSGASSRIAMEFDISSIGPDEVKSAALRLRPISMDIGPSLDLYGYAGDGVMSTADAKLTPFLIATNLQPVADTFLVVDTPVMATHIDTLRQAGQTFVGFMIKLSDDSFDGVKFASSENLNVSDRPVLTIEVQSNQPPVADAGQDRTAQRGEVVTLDGSGSKDPDGDLPLTYKWLLTSQPAGSTAALTNPTDVSTKLIPDVLGPYIVELVVTDSLGLSSVPDKVLITVENTAPVANAGPDQTTQPGDLVILDGSGSTDPDGDLPLAFDWFITSMPAGSTPVLKSTTSVNPTFSADLPGDYEIELTVTDLLGAISLPDQVRISTFNTAPVADAGPDQQITLVGETVQLDGSQSFDHDGDPITFLWLFESVPPGSGATLDDPASVSPTFVADTNGAYILSLVVQDDLGASSAPDFVKVSFDNLEPVADAGKNQSVTVGDTVLLNGSASTDPNLDPLAYEWSMVVQPDGSVAELDDPTAVMPAFIADLAGLYVVSLVVNDGVVDSVPDSVTITALSQQDAITQKVNEAMVLIDDLPSGVLKNDSMRKTLTKKLNVVLVDIDRGSYQGAINKLQQDVLSKTDGCATLGEPDANDWVKHCARQAVLYERLVEAIQLLEPLAN